MSSTPQKKQPYPFWLGGVAATIAASITHPLDLTKVRLQASGDKRMIESIKKTYRTADVVLDVPLGAYDESKKILSAGEGCACVEACTGRSMAGGIAGFVGNPGEIVMVRLQGDFAKPPEKRFNYKHCFRCAVFVYVSSCVFFRLDHMVREEGPSSLARRFGPDVFRGILKNANTTSLKAELLKTSYFQDNIFCHFTAVSLLGTVAYHRLPPRRRPQIPIMNASGPGSSSTMGVIARRSRTRRHVHVQTGCRRGRGCSRRRY
ncbi:hypothetical protein MSAN_02418800 [Mycena sanguinolenta]|uniref:Uncharacterized protein n=1 Tax=Mycena sanguinolenta TaxID=230812 RepID=A0A8H7CFJ4_9AGAR|nr:hypothetical protein MSAN_02418800 [Mycena sanguinolenta]